MKGNLSVMNGSKIDNFHIGVDKAGYGYYSEIPRGLTVESSTIKNCDVAISNTSYFATVKYSFIRGDVISTGLCYGNWLSNNITAKTFTLQASTQANRIENNLFQNLEFDLYGRNGRSVALCNTWSNVEGSAVLGHAGVVLPSAWGSKSKSSGNRHFDNSDPFMAASDDLINFYFQNEPMELFTYNVLNPLLTGKPILIRNTDCLYDYPIEEPVPIQDYPETHLDYTFEDSSWRAFNTLKLQKEELLTNATDSQAILLQLEIEDYDFQLDNIVGIVLANLTKADSNIEITWKDRSNPTLFVISNLTSLWYEQDFAGLSDLVEEIDDDDAATLLLASDFLQSHWNSTRYLDTLSSLEVDTLAKIATLTFGYYSNIIRDFLRVQYNRDIAWSTDTQVSYRSTWNQKRNSHDPSNVKYSIYKTLNQGCLSIKCSDEKYHDIFITLYDSQGKRLETKQTTNESDICFRETYSGIFILTLYEPKSNIFESHKILMF
ncbi:MAG: hypothetical protein WBP41_15785 [Saprospiraceae bacterium]